MFKRQILPKDSQLNNDQLANMLVAQTIAHLQQLTHLPAQQCEQLIKQQLNHQQVSQPIINHQESEFITRLFV